MQRLYMLKIKIYRFVAALYLSMEIKCVTKTYPMNIDLLTLLIYNIICEVLRLCCSYNIYTYNSTIEFCFKTALGNTSIRYF